MKTSFSVKRQEKEGGDTDRPGKENLVFSFFEPIHFYTRLGNTHILFINRSD